MRFAVALRTPTSSAFRPRATPFSFARCCRTDRLEALSSFQSTGPTSLRRTRVSTYSSMPSPILIRASRHPSMFLFAWSASPPPYTASQSLGRGRFCSKPIIGRWPDAKLVGVSNLLSRRRIVTGQDLRRLCWDAQRERTLSATTTRQQASSALHILPMVALQEPCSLPLSRLSCRATGLSSNWALILSVNAHASLLSPGVLDGPWPGGEPLSARVLGSEPIRSPPPPRQVASPSKR